VVGLCAPSTKRSLSRTNFFVAEYPNTATTAAMMKAIVLKIILCLLIGISTLADIGSFVH
jgi:hypothetical protein